MPNVPILREQVSLGALPASRQSAAGATSEAFGGGIGTALSGVGTAATGLAIKFREEENVLKAKEASLFAKQKLIDLENDLNSRKGEDAVVFGKEIIGGMGRGESAFEQIRQEAISGLTENQRIKFDQHWIPQQLAAVQATGKYMTAQRRVWQDSQDRAAEDLYGQSFVASPMLDDHTLNQTDLDMGMAAIRSRLSRAGISDEEITVAQQDWVVSRYADVVNRYISEGNVGLAEEFYEERRREGNIPEQDQKKFNDALKRAHQNAEEDKKRATAKAVGDSFNAASGTVELYMEALESADVAQLAARRAAAEAAIAQYETMSKEAGVTSGTKNASSMRRAIFAKETEIKTANIKATDKAEKEVLDDIDAQIDAIDADLRSGIHTWRELYPEALDLYGGKNTTPEQRREINRVIVKAKNDEKERIEKEGRVKDADHSNLVRELNGALRAKFLSLAKVDNVAELPAAQRAALGYMMDETERFARTAKSGKDVRDYWNSLAQPINDRKALKEAEDNVFQPPARARVAQDFTIPLKRTDEALIDEMLRNIREESVPAEPSKTPRAEPGRPPPIGARLNAL